eukprot:scaffold3208_cov402-Prasinococcus_capsulatus_cf.AAC.5
MCQRSCDVVATGEAGDHVKAKHHARCIDLALACHLPAGGTIHKGECYLSALRVAFRTYHATVHYI